MWKNGQTVDAFAGGQTGLSLHETGLIKTLAAGETIGVVILEARVPPDQVVLPAGESQSNLDAALRTGMRAKEFFILNLEGCLMPSFDMQGMRSIDVLKTAYLTANVLNIEEPAGLLKGLLVDPVTSVFPGTDSIEFGREQLGREGLPSFRLRPQLSSSETARAR